MKTTEQKNRMISEFMDVIKYRPYGDYIEINGDAYEFNDLKYHTSWDWLMPVVEKIKDMSFYKQEAMDRIDNILTCNLRINYLYDEVVQFIEWYNNFLDIEDQIASDMDRD